MEKGESGCNLALEAARRGPSSCSIPGKFASGPAYHAFPGFLAAEPAGDMAAPITSPVDASSEAFNMAEDFIDARPDCGQLGCANMGLRKIES